MNADFERDKGTYPYGPLRRGDSYFLAHIPAQVALCTVALPEAVVVKTSNRLNALYYGREDVGLQDSLKNITHLLSVDARAMLDAGTLDATHYQGIIDHLSATQV